MKQNILKAAIFIYAITIVALAIGIVLLIFNYFHSGPVIFENVKKLILVISVPAILVVMMRYLKFLLKNNST